MADLKIYNNGEGKILLSAGDRIIRQPYDFENGVYSPSSEYYIQFDTTGLLEGDFSIMGFSRIINSPGTAAVISIFTNEAQNAVDQVLGIAKRTSIHFRCNTSNLVQIEEIPVSNPGFFFYSFTYKQATGEYQYIINNVERSGITSIGENRNFVVFRRQFVGTSAVNFTNIVNGDIHVFSRSLNINEIRYYFNNMIGSRPQSLLGSVIASKLSKAEILSINTVDSVAIKDESGNNIHGKIMALPAGTLQEQLDWANTNLFVPFIS